MTWGAIVTLLVWLLLIGVTAVVMERRGRHRE